MSDTPRPAAMLQSGRAHYMSLQLCENLERELTEAKRGAARYEVVRKMNATDFALLYQRCIHMDLRFDDEVDKIGGLK